jgi:large subunit ribosomal protein L9
MQVILTKDVDELGQAGEVVDVNLGHYQNYLNPRKLAIVASKGSLKDLDTRRERLRLKAEKRYQADLAKKAKIEALQTITIEANVGEEGKLFGTITTKDLNHILHEKTGFDIDRKLIHVDRPISRIGDYTMTAKLSGKVLATLKLVIIANAASLEAIAAMEAAEALSTAKYGDEDNFEI